MRRIDSNLMDYMSVSPAIKNELDTELSSIMKKFDLDEDTDEDNLRMAEILSGIPALEKAIEEYLVKYSIPARIYDAASIFDTGIKKANATRKLIDDIETKKMSLSDINKNINRLQDFLVKGAGAQKLRNEMFPETWHESQMLKKELSTEERLFEVQIREKLVEWNPWTIDAQKTITPKEARELINDFICFMAGLTNTMLGVYANAVEDDAKRQFKDLKTAYEERIQVILGKMPPELQNFLNRFDFILRTDAQVNVKIEDLIIETTKEELEHYQREISLEKDGAWKAFVSILPFTDTTTDDTRVKKVKVQRVNFDELKTNVKAEASNVLQAGLKKAESMASSHYATLRLEMIKQFDRIDQTLQKFKEDLQTQVESRANEDSRLKEFRETLNWVKQFQERLNHILDLEA